MTAGSTKFHQNGKRSRVSARDGKTRPSPSVVGTSWPPERRHVQTARRSNPLTFRANVFEIVRRIPRGKTLTYKEVARRAGNPGAARAVGAILKTNFNPKIPCHRVIKSDGTLGGYNRGVRTKRRLLRDERLV